MGPARASTKPKCQATSVGIAEVAPITAASAAAPATQFPGELDRHPSLDSHLSSTSGGRPHKIQVSNALSNGSMKLPVSPSLELVTVLPIQTGWKKNLT